MYTLNDIMKYEFILCKCQANGLMCVEFELGNSKFYEEKLLLCFLKTTFVAVAFNQIYSQSVR